MAAYADLDGVRTWYDELGQGEPLVALHPGLVDARALADTGGLARRDRALSRRRREDGQGAPGGPDPDRGRPRRRGLPGLVMMADDTNDPVPTLAPVRRRPPRQTRAAGQASSNASPSGLATTTV